MVTGSRSKRVSRLSRASRMSRRKPRYSLKKATKSKQVTRSRRIMRKRNLFKTRWQIEHQSVGIGPLKKGELGKFGYSSFKPAPQRHTSLAKASRSLGSLSVFRKLNALYVYNKNRAPLASRKFKQDRDYVKKTFM
jgi:hypothetical protein